MTKTQSFSRSPPGAGLLSFFSRGKGSLRILMTTSPSVRLSELSNSLRDRYRVSGIGKLISDGAVIACYPLHDGTRYTTVSLGFIMSVSLTLYFRARRGNFSMTSGLRSVNFGNINPWTPSEITTGSRWVSTLLGWVSSLAIFSWHAAALFLHNNYF